MLLIGVVTGFTSSSRSAFALEEPGVHQLSTADLGALLDPLIERQLERLKIAGAVVVVVKDSAILLAKGYGYADVENKRPMTADATLVRPGSISKLFTGIAVMQLVEQDKLDLDRDVNDNLVFHFPTPDGGVPVTLRRLMTHRAGFEEHVKDLFSSDPVPEPLGPWLARSLPRRLILAGDVPAYSNYGMALAGYTGVRSPPRC
jgi:CubicO group peptidase (beta-lactamase class C family)